MKTQTKLFILLSGLLLLLPFISSNASPLVETKEVTVSVGDAYVPPGFSATSEVHVVVNGYFPNGCYLWQRADVSKDNDFVTIRSVASVRQGLCIMVRVPFTEEVSIGKLEAGDHTLRFLNNDGTYFEKNINITE